MIKIAIVDDEVLVRQGIKSYIESSGEQMEVAGTFSNAKDVIDFLQHNSVHILITDIKMAQMNGVDLIRHCVNYLYPMGIIVLSCHDSFEYARDVFALGADAYILKHEVSQHQLISEIKKTYIRLRRTTSDWHEQPEFGESSALYQPAGVFAVGYIGFRTKYDRFNRIKSKADRKIVADVVTEIIKSNHIGDMINTENDMLVCLQAGSKSDTEGIKDKAALAAKHLSVNLMNYFNERVFFAVSCIHTERNGFQAAVDEAKLAAESAFYDTESLLFMYTDRKRQGDEAHLVFHTRPIDLQSEEWRKGFAADLKYYLQTAKQNGLPPKKLIQNMQGFLYKLEDHLYGYYDATFRSMKDVDAEGSSLELMDNCEIVAEYVMHIVEKSISYVGELKDTDAAFHRIVEYIDNHYNEPITLQMLSDTFHINPTYLCKLFKENLNKSFVNYLNGLRIGHARQLLAGSRLSLDEIAEMTGFNNSNYFVRVFKKTTGMTIGEYRKK